MNLSFSHQRVVIHPTAVQHTISGPKLQHLRRCAWCQLIPYHSTHVVAQFFNITHADLILLTITQEGCR